MDKKWIMKQTAIALVARFLTIENIKPLSGKRRQRRRYTGDGNGAVVSTVSFW